MQPEGLAARHKAKQDRVLITSFSRASRWGPRHHSGRHVATLHPPPLLVVCGAHERRTSTTTAQQPRGDARSLGAVSLWRAAAARRCPLLAHLLSTAERRCGSQLLGRALRADALGCVHSLLPVLAAHLHWYWHFDVAQAPPMSWTRLPFFGARFRLSRQGRGTLPSTLMALSTLLDRKFGKTSCASLSSTSAS